MKKFLQKKKRPERYAVRDFTEGIGLTGVTESYRLSFIINGLDSKEDDMKERLFMVWDFDKKSFVMADQLDEYIELNWYIYGNKRGQAFVDVKSNRNACIVYENERGEFLPPLNTMEAV